MTHQREIALAFLATPLCGICLAQTPTLRFEAASVKPSTTESIPSGPGKFSKFAITDSRLTVSGLTLKVLLERAYNLKPWQIACPGWMETAKYDVVATFPNGTLRNQVPEMLRNLLAERFGLVTHNSQNEQSVFALMVAKSGAKLKKPDPPGTIGDDLGHVKGVGTSGFSGTANLGDGPFGPGIMSMRDGVLHYEYSQMTMANLAEFLSNGLLGLPVAALEGHYHVDLDISTEDMTATIPPELRAAAPATEPGSALADPAGKSVYSSIEKLGLRLERSKAPIDQLVVDHAEKIPTPN